MTVAPHILIVEDDRIQRAILRDIISQYFPTAMVTTVATGYDALLAYQARGADLWILDQWLPDVRGRALLHYLRATGVTTPVILLAGVRARAAVPSATRTSVLSKPIEIPAFVATITQALAAGSVVLTA